MARGRFVIGVAAVVSVAVLSALLPVVAQPVGAVPVATYEDVVLDDSPLAYFPLDHAEHPLTEFLGSSTMSAPSGAVRRTGVLGRWLAMLVMGWNTLSIGRLCRVVLVLIVVSSFG